MEVFCGSENKNFTVTGPYTIHEQTVGSMPNQEEYELTTFVKKSAIIVGHSFTPFL